MKKWDNQKALYELKEILEELQNLYGSHPHSSEHTRWLFKTSSLLRSVFGQSSNLYNSFFNIKWRYAGTWLVSIDDMNLPGMGKEKYDLHHFKKVLGFAKGILLAAQDELEKHNIETLYEGKNSEDEASSIIKIVHLLEHKLRKMISEQPSDEKDVQNIVEKLLIASDTEYKREFPVISYSSKNYIPDFSFSRISLALEIKICNRKGREKELIKEINDDIMAYSKVFSNLLFLIYDLGLIRDVELFSREFEKDNSVLVKVIKH